MSGFFLSDGRHGSRSLPRGCSLYKMLSFMHQNVALKLMVTGIRNIGSVAELCTTWHENKHSKLGMSKYGLIKIF